MPLNSLLPCVEIEPKTPAEASVVWLHGLGADGHDFAPVARMLQPMLNHTLRFVLPHAPRIPVTLNGGVSMPAWYDMQNMDHPRNVDWDTVKDSEKAICALLERERSRGIATDKIFLAGFSQGGAITLRIALQRKQKLGGILALSTYLLQNAGEEFPVNKHDPLPVFMGHGTQDPIIPHALAEASRNTLKQYGCAIDWHSYPMAHSVCQEEIDAIAQWFNKQLAHQE